LASARGEGKRREIRIVGESATMSSNVGSKRRGSGRVTTGLIENINLSLPKHMLLLYRISTAVSLNF
jgi:hypothetical protein